MVFFMLGITDDQPAATCTNVATILMDVSPQCKEQKLHDGCQKRARSQNRCVSLTMTPCVCGPRIWGILSTTNKFVNPTTNEHARMIDDVLYEAVDDLENVQCR